MSVLGSKFDELDHKVVLEKLLIGIIESDWRTNVDYECYGEKDEYNYLVALDKLFDYIIGETEAVGFVWDDYTKMKELFLQDMRNKNAKV